MCAITALVTNLERNMSTHFASKTGRVAAGGSLLVGGVAGALVLAPQAGAATTYTVTNTADSGAGSLRQAIDEANSNAGADIIVFDAGSAGTITLTTGQLDISDDVTITGLGKADSIISGNNASRIFYIYNSAASLTVSISGLTMTDGYVGNRGEGGAIANWGNDLTLSNVVLTGNEATGDGGAIWSQYSASSNTDRYAPLTIVDSEITGNSAGFAGGGLGLYQMGDVTITNTVVSGNTANVAKGGGLSVKEVGNVSIVGSVFQYNVSNSQGAGISLYQTGDVSIDSTTIDQNISTRVITAGTSAGGGVYAFATDSFTMTNSTVSGNEASYSGGIHLGNNGDVLIANSTIANNVANDGDGGALYSWESNGDTRIMFSTISGNSSRSNIVKMVNLSDNEVEIIGTIISDNTTQQGNGIPAWDLYLYGSSSASVSNSLIMGISAGDPLINGGGNLRGESAQLGALADNGGATFTMEPAVGSPVIDAGPLTLTSIFDNSSFDQRGTPYTRGYNGRPDIGAFETQPGSVSSTTTSSTSTTSTTTAPTTTTTAPSSTSTSTTLLGSIDTTTTVGTDPVAPAFTG